MSDSHDPWASLADSLGVGPGGNAPQQPAQPPRPAPRPPAARKPAPPKPAAATGDWDALAGELGIAGGGGASDAAPRPAPLRPAREAHPPRDQRRHDDDLPPPRRQDGEPRRSPPPRREDAFDHGPTSAGTDGERTLDDGRSETRDRGPAGAEGDDADGARRGRRRRGRRGGRGRGRGERTGAPEGRRDDDRRDDDRRDDRPRSEAHDRVDGDGDRPAVDREADPFSAGLESAEPRTTSRSDADGEGRREARGEEGDREGGRRRRRRGRRGGRGRSRGTREGAVREGEPQAAGGPAGSGSDLDDEPLPVGYGRTTARPAEPAAGGDGEQAGGDRSGRRRRRRRGGGRTRGESGSGQRERRGEGRSSSSRSSSSSSSSSLSRGRRSDFAPVAGSYDEDDEGLEFLGLETTSRETRPADQDLLEESGLNSVLDVPSWVEAIGIVIAGNLDARSRSGRSDDQKSRR